MHDIPPYLKFILIFMAALHLVHILMYAMLFVMLHKYDESHEERIDNSRRETIEAIRR